MLSIAIDLHRNILSAQCCIKFELQNTLIDKMQLVCEKSSLSISLIQSDEFKHNIKIITPHNFFIPSSVSKNSSTFDAIEYENNVVKILQNNNFSMFEKVENQSKDSIEPKKFSTKATIELCARFQVSGSDIISSHSSNEKIFSSMFHYLKSEIIPNDVYKVICTNCGSLISSNNLSFRFVKEHCNTHSELSESWFCHKNNSPQTVTELKNDVLHVDDTFIYLHASLFSALNVKKDGVHYICEQCKNPISPGHVMQSLHCIYADAIIFTKTEESDQCDYKNFHLQLVLLSLWSIISQKLTAGKLFLQSKKGEKDICILIWVPPNKIAQFKFQTTIDEMPSEVNFSTEEVYKVQYYVGTLISPPIQKWKKDFSVDFYKVSYHFMRTVEEILITSSKWIPEEKNSISDFSNGYIPSTFKVM